MGERAKLVGNTEQFSYGTRHYDLTNIFRPGVVLSIRPRSVFGVPQRSDVIGIDVLVWNDFIVVIGSVVSGDCKHNVISMLGLNKWIKDVYYVRSIYRERVSGAAGCLH